MKKKRVLHVIASTIIGGAPEIVRSLVKYGNKNQFEIHVATTNDGPYFDMLKQAGAKVIEVNMQGQKIDVMKIQKIKQVLKEGKYDVLHAHGARAGFLTSFSNMSLNIPLIYTGHGHAFEGRKNSIMKRFYIWVEKFIMKRANLVVSISESDKKLALKHKIVNENKLAIVTNGIDFDRVFARSASEDLRKSIGVREGEYLIGTLARITQQKGPFLFLDIIETLVTENDNIKVVWIGDGDLRGALEREARQRGIENKFKVIGYKDNGVQLMSQLDALIMSSLYEPFGLVAIEAMLGKVPIVASQVGALPDLIKHGETGYIFPLNNIVSARESILHVLNEENRNKIVKNAYAYAFERYNAEEMVKEYELFYRNLTE